MFLYYIGMITLYYWMEASLPLAKRAGTKCLSLDGSFVFTHKVSKHKIPVIGMETLFPLTKRAFPVKERMIGINYD